MTLLTVDVDGALCGTDLFGVWKINPGGVAPGAFEVIMNGPAWSCLDYAQFWVPRSQRGQNAVVPGATGTRALPRRITETEYQLAMPIVGAVFQDGTPWSNPIEGLRQNLLWLAENVVDPPPLPAVTRSSTLTSPDGLTTMTAEIQVTQLEMLGHIDDIIPTAIVHVIIPAGGFEEPVS